MIYLLEFKYLYFFVMILCCFLGRSSEVEANQVFKIENIEVDEASHTAIAAREKALEKGQKKAWELLVRRVTLSGGNSQIIELSFDEIKKLGSELRSCSREGFTCSISSYFNCHL